MSDIAHGVRRLARDIDFETDFRDLTDDELIDLWVASQTLDAIIACEAEARGKTALQLILAQVRDEKKADASAKKRRADVAVLQAAE